MLISSVRLDASATKISVETSPKYRPDRLESNLTNAGIYIVSKAIYEVIKGRQVKDIGTPGTHRAS